MTHAEQIEIKGRNLLLYDGVCALCHGVVSFLLQHDRRDRLRYAPLQSALGREVLTRFGVYTFPDGVMLLADALTPAERLYQRSDAVGAALGLLHGRWRTLGRALMLIPKPLREFGYGMVARIRYRLFGRYDACPLPPPHQRSRVLGVNK
jgi:predicted DCC family thiol-disulfide oxidoreductase YuxK